MKNEESGGVPILGLFEFWAPQKSSFSTGFIRFFDTAERHVIYSEKPNAFLMILESIFRKWPGNDQFEQGFIRVFATRFCISQNVEFDRFYKVFRRAEKVLRKPSLGNAFLMILGPFFRK